MKLLFSNFGYQRTSWRRWLDDAARSGCDGVELWGIAPHVWVDRPGEGARLRRQLDAAGLTCRVFTPEQVLYPVNLASADAEMCRRSVAWFAHAARVAAELGASGMLVTAGTGVEDEPPEAALDRALDGLAAVIGTAAQEGVEVWLEPLQRAESTIITTVADAAAVARELDLDVVLDTCAAAAAGETAADYVSRLGPRIRHVHLVDGRPTGHLAPGDGDLPLRAWTAELQEAGYDGAFTMELLGSGIATDPWAAYERGRAVVESSDDVTNP